MEKSSSVLKTPNPKQEKGKPKKKTPSKTKGECSVSQSTSHTQFFREDKTKKVYKRITTDEYFGMTESISGSSDTFRCDHGRQGKQYSEKGQLKRNLLKNLDPVPKDLQWNDSCAPAYGWDMAKTLEFLVTDPMGVQQVDRLATHLRGFARTASSGYKIDILDSLCTILDYLVETYHGKPSLREGLVLMLQNMDKPILLNVNSDVVTYFEMLRRYLCFMGYLLMRLEEDDLFDLVSKGMIWHLSAPDTVRTHSAAQLRHTLAAAAPVLYHTSVRMLAVATPHRFSTFLDMSLLLAIDTVENCIEMMLESIIENIFYRFNPYFPERELPVYEVNPADLQDYNVKLGESSTNISAVLSLLLVLVKTTDRFLEENPKYRQILPCPDEYSQRAQVLLFCGRCFVWAYRYECRAREHRHQRMTLTVIASVLLKIFGDRLSVFSNVLMPDVMFLAVLTEVPPRRDWTHTVNFNISQTDVQFKKLLIFLSVDFLKVFPYNKFLVESQHWLLGLMYLLDPGLCHLRSRWPASLFAELRKTSLQALVCTMPIISSHLATEYGMIRRLMWYIEWYTESPYELSVLYWCMRLLHVSIQRRSSPSRQDVLRDLFDTHGIIILIHLCHTLLKPKLPPMEKSQAIIAICLRLLTSAVEANTRVSCCVYGHIKWPSSVNSLVRKMLDIVLYSLGKQCIVSDRWLISLLNFIWQAVIWRKDYRERFIAENGIYDLLDIITMTRRHVQCIALALVCDATRTGETVGQLVSWRASIGAANAHPNVVKRGTTIAGLLAAIFKDDCIQTGASLDEHGILQGLDNPLMSAEIRAELKKPDQKEGKSQRTAICLTAAGFAGSRMAKVFALYYMLSEDLDYKVLLADEAYNMYKNIQLSPEDEAVLVLCSHFLTLKLNETWYEALVQSSGFVPQDNDILEEFLHIGKGWAKEIKRQQEDVKDKHDKKDREEESSFHAFIGRVRLNCALEALRDVRCTARSADRSRIAHALLHDAVRAHHRRSVMVKKLDAPVLRTYGPTLDDQNITGQNLKVYSILPRHKPKPRDNMSSSPTFD